MCNILINYTKSALSNNANTAFHSLLLEGIAKKINTLGMPAAKNQSRAKPPFDVKVEASLQMPPTR